MSHVLLFTIHSTTPWWRYLGSQLDFAKATVFSDMRGDGDFSIIDEFYRAIRHGKAEQTALSAYGEDGVSEIILRCRVLRSLERDVAVRMIGGMHEAVSRAFDSQKPDLVMTFTMDRYVMDVMERVARSRGIDFVEMTTSIIPNETMFMRRGNLIPVWEPTDEEVDARTAVLYQPDFAPSYIRDAKRFDVINFWKIFGYFELRGAFFNAYRFARRDPLGIHYLDARKSLKHKVRLSDVRALSLFDRGWRQKLSEIPREKCVFFGLQLFPEASLDYWVRDRSMLAHDDVVIRYCEVLAGAGFHIFVKDHPLQFGFRQRELIERLARLPGVTLVPYDVPASVMLAECSVSVTLTGTIGFQAALAGLCSVVTEPFYSTPDHYVHVRNFSEIDTVADRVLAWRRPDDMDAARRHLVRHLAKGSVPGDYFTWRKFDGRDPAHREAAAPLVRSLNTYLPRFIANSAAGAGGERVREPLASRP